MPFAYDSSAPLELAVHGASGAVADISYASPLGGMVPAWLVTPEGDGPHAGIVYVHPGQGDRSTFLDEAALMAQRGAVCLLIDAPYLRPGSAPPGPLPDGEADAREYRQLVIDVRRGLDLLLARGDVDPGRLGYVGHSLGATWGGPLAGVERRLKGLVLMAGYPSLTDWHRRSEHPLAARFREALGPEGMERYLAPLEPLDGVHYIGKAAPAALLFQFAREDEFVSAAEAEAYSAAASEPKQVNWYKTDHLFTTAPQAREDRVMWLSQQLGLAGKLPLA